MEFNLNKLKQDTNKGTPRFIRFAYAEEDVKEFIKLLKFEANDNRTISSAREEDCVLIETLNLIINQLAGDKFK